MEMFINYLKQLAFLAGLNFLKDFLKLIRAWNFVLNETITSSIVNLIN